MSDQNPLGSLDLMMSLLHQVTLGLSLTESGLLSLAQRLCRQCAVNLITDNAGYDTRRLTDARLSNDGEVATFDAGDYSGAERETLAPKNATESTPVAMNFESSSSTSSSTSILLNTTLNQNNSRVESNSLSSPTRSTPSFKTVSNLTIESQSKPHKTSSSSSSSSHQISSPPLGAKDTTNRSMIVDDATTSTATVNLIGSAIPETPLNNSTKNEEFRLRSSSENVNDVDELEPGEIPDEDTIFKNQNYFADPNARIDSDSNEKQENNELDICDLFKNCSKTNVSGEGKGAIALKEETSNSSESTTGPLETVDDTWNSEQLLRVRSSVAAERLKAATEEVVALEEQLTRELTRGGEIMREIDKEKERNEMLLEDLRRLRSRSKDGLWKRRWEMEDDDDNDDRSEDGDSVKRRKRDERSSDEENTDDEKKRGMVKMKKKKDQMKKKRNRNDRDNEQNKIHEEDESISSEKHQDRMTITIGNKTKKFDSLADHSTSFINKRSNLSSNWASDGRPHYGFSNNFKKFKSAKDFEFDSSANQSTSFIYKRSNSSGDRAFDGSSNKFERSNSFKGLVPLMKIPSGLFPTSDASASLSPLQTPPNPLLRSTFPKSFGPVRGSERQRRSTVASRNEAPYSFCWRLTFRVFNLPSSADVSGLSAIFSRYGVVDANAARISPVPDDDDSAEARVVLEVDNYRAVTTALERLVGQDAPSVYYRGSKPARELRLVFEGFKKERIGNEACGDQSLSFGRK